VGIESTRARFVFQEFALAILPALEKSAPGHPGGRAWIEEMTLARPQMHILAAGRLYPKAWRQADQLRADRWEASNCSLSGNRLILIIYIPSF
jgi:hypothetical protein